uniref:Uncharacterized protein n=1 Tax=Monopterus albus TaxID=43700 RepID=A0A3Q3K8V6_MONAL
PSASSPTTVRNRKSKKKLDAARSKTRINIGVVFEQCSSQAVRIVFWRSGFGEKSEQKAIPYTKMMP